MSCLSNQRKGSREATRIDEIKHERRTSLATPRAAAAADDDAEAVNRSAPPLRRSAEPPVRNMMFKSLERRTQRSRRESLLLSSPLFLFSLFEIKSQRVIFLFHNFFAFVLTFTMLARSARAAVSRLQQAAGYVFFGRFFDFTALSTTFSFRLRRDKAC